MRAFSVNIIGLSNKVHQFDYEFGDEFFRHFGTDLVSGGSFRADVTLDKRETFIEVTFAIQGTANLICDRSLEPFDHPVKIKKKVLFKFGEADEEISDEIVIIHRDTVSLELGQYIYEFISLEIPMKKLHPKFQQEEENSEEDDANGKIIYSSGSSDNNDNNDIDPRWEQLKKLK
ncbi:MAG: YceD family protein [Bacteroidota bacterium]